MGEAQFLVKCGEDGVCGGNIHLGKVHVLCLVVILNGDRNKGQEVLVLMVFLAFKGCCSTEMEWVAGGDRRKCSFLKNQLIRPARAQEQEYLKKGNSSFYKTYLHNFSQKCTILVLFT
jgi:hypothetical protein